VEQSCELRDALAKTLYERVFNFLVNKLNSAMQYPGTTNLKAIGILDAFGFEKLKSNSFEQVG
jgi:myosin-1